MGLVSDDHRKITTKIIYFIYTFGLNKSSKQVHTPLNRHSLHSNQKSGKNHVCFYTLQDITDALRNKVRRIMKLKKIISPFITALKLHKLFSLTSNLFMLTKI